MASHTDPLRALLHPTTRHETAQVVLAANCTALAYTSVDVVGASVAFRTAGEHNPRRRSLHHCPHFLQASCRTTLNRRRSRLPAVPSCSSARRLRGRRTKQLPAPGGRISCTGGRRPRRACRAAPSRASRSCCRTSSSRASRAGGVRTHTQSKKPAVTAELHRRHSHRSQSRQCGTHTRRRHTHAQSHGRRRSRVPQSHPLSPSRHPTTVFLDSKLRPTAPLHALERFLAGARFALR